MSILSSAFHSQLANDPALVADLDSYDSGPAIFTIEPIPGDFEGSVYIVTVGEVASLPADCKNSLGRDFIRDVRIYDKASGSSIKIERIAERVRALFHRQEVVISGYSWQVSNVTGPIVANETDSYGRIVSVELIIREV